MVYKEKSFTVLFYTIIINFKLIFHIMDGDKPKPVYRAVKSTGGVDTVTELLIKRTAVKSLDAFFVELRNEMTQLTQLIPSISIHELGTILSFVNDYNCA